MLLNIFVIIISLIALFTSANFFIDGAVAVAHRFGISTLLVGVIIMGFGTSAPEIVVSVFAALNNATGIALGNAYGSNIVNIAIVLGITALVNPIIVPSKVIKLEMPLLIAISILSFIMLLSGTLSRMESSILLALFAGYIGLTLWQSRKAIHENSGELHTPSQADATPLSKAMIFLIGGLAILVISARGFVWGASNLAMALGVSELVIGLTIVSLGTSLPELSSTIVAAVKRQHDMALGNIIGSNIFNTLAVVGLTGIIRPVAHLELALLQRDIPIMIGFSVLLLIFSLSIKKNHRINRLEGAILVILYIAYIVLLIKSA